MIDPPNQVRKVNHEKPTLANLRRSALGIAAQAFLAWGLIFHVMPALGLDLLDMARAVAAFDLPARIGQLFTGIR